MNKVLDFLKGVPKFIYILLFVIIAFVIILQMKNDEEAQKVQKTEIDNANTKIADEARIKSKEIVPMANQPVSGTGVVETKEVAINRIAPFNAITTKFAKPIVMGSNDFKEVKGFIMLTEQGAFKLGIRFDGNMITPITLFLNNRLAGPTTVKNQSYEFTFDKNFIITGAKIPGVPDESKMQQLEKLYKDLAMAFQAKKEFKVGEMTIPYDSLEKKIVEVRKELAEIRKGATSMSTTEYSGKNIVEVMGTLKVD